MQIPRQTPIAPLAPVDNLTGSALVTCLDRMQTLTDEREQIKTKLQVRKIITALCMLPYNKTRRAIIYDIDFDSVYWSTPVLTFAVSLRNLSEIRLRGIYTKRRKTK